MHAMYLMVNINIKVIIVIIKFILMSLIHIFHGPVVKRKFLYIFTETLD